MTQPSFGKDSAERHRHRDLKLLERGAFGEAVEQFRRNRRAHPGLLADRILLSQALLQGGRPGDAEAELRHALQIAPDNPDVHAHLGRVAA